MHTGPQQTGSQPTGPDPTVADHASDDSASEAVAFVPPEPRLANWLTSLEAQLKDPNEYAPDVQERIYFIIRPEEDRYSGRWTAVEVVTSRVDAEGRTVATKRLNVNSVRAGNLPRHALPADAKLLKSLTANCPASGTHAIYRLSGEEGARHLEAILATGRAKWLQAGGASLMPGGPRPGRWEWVSQGQGDQKFEVVVPGAVALSLAPPWYVDAEQCLAGPIETDLPPAVAKALLEAPVIAPESAGFVRSELARLFPGRPELLPAARKPARIVEVQPIPVLTIRRQILSERKSKLPDRLLRADRRSVRASPAADRKQAAVAVGVLRFRYGSELVAAGDSEIRVEDGDSIVIMPRHFAFERACRSGLARYGWQAISQLYAYEIPRELQGDLYLAAKHGEGSIASDLVLQEFLASDAGALRQQGWRVESDFEFHVVRDSEVRWDLDANDDERDWFGLRLGVVVAGVRVDLKPVLVSALQMVARRTKTGRIEELPDDAPVFHPLPSGDMLSIPLSRLKPILSALIELFGPVAGWPDDLRLPRTRAGDANLLDEAARAAGLEWRAPDRLRRMMERLASFDKIAAVRSPRSLCGELRQYQSEGLAWMQFLAEFEFGGILADDMGLGKTVQTIAHILTEREAGRLVSPVLIVAPTSTLPNWRHEVRRFAPTLRLLTLHGGQRGRRFASIPEHDVVLTSYPLVSRDRALLARYTFHLVVLDEAQNIKNPTTAVARACCELKTRHRLCLSGTPVENHLEELWSLFHFLSPGLFGGMTDFRRDFRVPIEKAGDPAARERLARRIRPFVLRRTKELVAPELPEKNEVIERVELSGPQRDLYESLRLAMDERVRELFASKGLERSRIEILDALLKLRQVCCDPRLVKLDSAKKVRDSAKLDRLLEMLAELRERDRKVLVFSQFTSMLDLIEERLREAGYPWVRISGNTVDRDSPVRQFQSGEVPIFLISLRAGGTGLNLTAADTVIHYDPWWNPAVERQATDRAHRIGQTKSVFVYKLIAEGTVEEKILELQARKAELAGALLDDASDLAAGLSQDDLKSLFEG